MIENCLVHLTIEVGEEQEVVVPLREGATVEEEVEVVEVLVVEEMVVELRHFHQDMKNKKCGHSSHQLTTLAAGFGNFALLCRNHFGRQA